MASEASSDVKFDIGHVLFIDIVGYSKLLINEQTDQIETLRRIVRQTTQVRKAELEGKLILLPAGDGGALVFRTTPEAPVACAVEIAHALKEHPELRIRMGVHSGPVNQVADLNEQANVAGAGVNLAQRVMACGDAGHILLSKRVADDLSPYPKWNGFLHDLGGCEVKHGVQIQLVNFFTDEAGNPARPSKCVSTGTTATGDAAREGRRMPVGLVAAGAIALMIIAAGVGYFTLWRQPSTKTAVNESSPLLTAVNSIAVLPFENASDDPNAEYLSEGISEALINSLTELQQLKVIARSTAFHYKGKDVDPKRVGRELQVATVLTGKVRQIQDALSVQVDLVDAATGAQLWGAGYDRKISDVVAVKQTIAREVTEKLKLKLSGEDQHRLVKRDTTNGEAYQFYLRGRYLWNKVSPKD